MTVVKPMKPELLAPAGSEEALHAAVQAGADAVYLGAGAFNARQTAGQFDAQTLTAAVEYAHARGVKVYVTLNTLVREDEFAALEEDVRMIARAKADAVLVQDFGVARCIHRMVPQLPLHASTQMAVHNRTGVRFMKEQGFARVVLAREMTLREIRACALEGIELEVFVHGALCVACSGQCLFSSLVGGRSGNRGRCAQPCRRRYTFDGIESYALSTRDLCAVENVEELCAAGVSSLKIEGRLKRSEYVASVTKAYRDALDGRGQPDVEALRQMFNRGGFTHGYLPEVQDDRLMYAKRPNHVGVPVGKAIKNGKILAQRALCDKDVLVLRGAEGEDRPVVLHARENETVACTAAHSGDVLVRLVSDAQMRSARALFEDEKRTTPLHAALALHVGEPASLTVFDGTDAVAVAGQVVQSAQKAATAADRLCAQLEKTGGTAYRFESTQVEMDESVFFPVSAVNALRRDALKEWFERHERAPYVLRPAPETAAFPQPVSAPEIVVQSARPDVLRRAVAAGAKACFAPNDVRLPALNAALEQLPEQFALALPCVLEEESLSVLHTWALESRGRIPETRLSNVAHFALSWPGALAADMMLHAANCAAVTQLNEWGCVRITPSIELTTAQIRALKAPLDLVVHGRIPLMQLRHCPYRAVHGLKGRHADCSRCDTCAPEARVTGRTLTDERGASFPLQRVATPNGCVVRVLNSVPLMLLRKAVKLPAAYSWRLLLEEGDPVEELVNLYAAAANGMDVRACAQWSVVKDLQTTTGHYFRGVE